MARTDGSARGLANPDTNAVQIDGGYRRQQKRFDVDKQRYSNRANAGWCTQPCGIAGHVGASPDG
jgi:hypothetical protein